MTMIRDGNGNVIDLNNPLAVTIAGANSGNGALGVDIQSSQIIQPVDIQARYAQTIQTHNAVSVTQNATSQTSWIDANGFYELALTMMLDASFPSDGRIYWSNDGVNYHGAEAILPSTTPSYSNTRAGSTQVKARYFKVGITNSDPVAVNHIMSAWVYLKA